MAQNFRSYIWQFYF